MDKNSWNKVVISSKTQRHPASRWGHCCCVIGDQIIFFGGYADSNYMNDLWSYNTSTMEWIQIKTTGDIPSNRSNCSMSYDSINNRIVLFGGGGTNKQRYNQVLILNWATKQWLELKSKQNQPSPWQRTYHCAQLVYPYLIVFGGEGVTDLDDLWIFNFQTLSWKQVPIDKQKPRPCARRFHSSAIVKNQFFVIAGCHGKYRPLSDIYSLDLSNFLKTGNINSLQWKQKKIKSSTFLSRWGQSTSVYDNKIYVFGGRFSNDLNDILVIDLEKQTMKTLKTTLQAPKPRRRHCGCFIGSCLIVFGGFNGQYFNDLNYINVFQLKSKFSIPADKQQQNELKFLENPQFADYIIHTISDDQIPIHKGLLIKCFESYDIMMKFLFELDGSYNKDVTIQLLKTLYLGYGKNSSFLLQKYNVKLEETQKQFKYQLLTNLLISKIQMINCIGNQICHIEQSQLMEYIDRLIHRPKYSDYTLKLNNQYCLPINSIKLSTTSKYFSNLFSETYFESTHNQNRYIELETDVFIKPIVFQIFLIYLQFDVLLVPKNINENLWIQLASVSHYYQIEKLFRICQQQLCLKANITNLKNLYQFAIQFSMNILIQWCIELYFQNNLSNNIGELFEININRVGNQQQKIINLYNALKFDIEQKRLRKDTDLKKKWSKDSCSTQGEKQNYQYNYNQ